MSKDYLPEMPKGQCPSIAQYISAVKVDCIQSDHLPKTCEEYAADLKTDSIHTVEEAMTDALIKKCPRCRSSILKEYGCNKMTCSRCCTMFCFVCGEQVKGELAVLTATKPD